MACKGLAQCRVLLHHARGIQGGLHVQNGVLAVFKHRVEAAQHGHRQDDIAVCAAHVKVPQHVVGDVPDVVGNPVQVAVIRTQLCLVDTAPRGQVGPRGVRAVGRPLNSPPPASMPRLFLPYSGVVTRFSFCGRSAHSGELANHHAILRPVSANVAS